MGQWQAGGLRIAHDRRRCGCTNRCYPCIRLTHVLVAQQELGYIGSGFHINDDCGVRILFVVGLQGVA